MKFISNRIDNGAEKTARGQRDLKAVGFQKFLEGNLKTMGPLWSRGFTSGMESSGCSAAKAEP
jgi:hypothetical protein